MNCNIKEKLLVNGTPFALRCANFYAINSMNHWEPLIRSQHSKPDWRRAYMCLIFLTSVLIPCTYFWLFYHFTHILIWISLWFYHFSSPFSFLSNYCCGTMSCVIYLSTHAFSVDYFPTTAWPKVFYSTIRRHLRLFIYLTLK